MVTDLISSHNLVKNLEKWATEPLESDLVYDYRVSLYTAYPRGGDVNNMPNFREGKKFDRLQANNYEFTGSFDI